MPVAFVGVAIIVQGAKTGSIGTSSVAVSRAHRPRTFWTLMAAAGFAVLAAASVVARWRDAELAQNPPTPVPPDILSVVEFASPALIAFVAGAYVLRLAVHSEVSIFGRRYCRDTHPAGFWALLAVPAIICVMAVLQFFLAVAKAV